MTPADRCQSSGAKAPELLEAAWGGGDAETPASRPRPSTQTTPLRRPRPLRARGLVGVVVPCRREPASSRKAGPAAGRTRELQQRRPLRLPGPRARRRPMRQDHAGLQNKRRCGPCRRCGVCGRGCLPLRPPPPALPRASPPAPDSALLLPCTCTCTAPGPGFGRTSQKSGSPPLRGLSVTACLQAVTSHASTGLRTLSG